MTAHHDHDDGHAQTPQPTPSRPLSRRQVLKGGLAAGAFLVARPRLAVGGEPVAFADSALPHSGASRRSRLFGGTVCAHADMHNHTHLSDGAGDHEFAFASMRDGGLDIAALTDHSTLSWGPAGAVTEVACSTYDGEPEHGQSQDCRSLACIDEERWEQTRTLADAANAPGEFVALRGFEWSSPFLGHINVWFSERWIDPLHTGGIDSSGLGEHFREGGDLGDLVGGVIDEFARGNPAHSGMLPFYEWLAADPATPVLGGGADGIACFNHPGRETGRFSYFQYHPAVADRFVAMEILNRREDYLFRSFDDGQPSPLVECLNAGWRVGLIGVTDEHGTEWGHFEDKGRAGVWITQLSRAALRQGLEERRVFATFERGLRLDAAARTHPAGGPDWTGQPGGGWVRMGRTVEHDAGRVQFVVDLDIGDAWTHAPVEIQVLRPGDEVPAVVHVESASIPSDDEALIAFTVDLDVADGDWVVLRIADPTRTNPDAGPEGHGARHKVLAYTSPWWLAPPAPRLDLIL